MDKLLALTAEEVTELKMNDIARAEKKLKDHITQTKKKKKWFFLIPGLMMVSVSFLYLKFAFISSGTIALLVMQIMTFGLINISIFIFAFMVGTTWYKFRKKEGEIDLQNELEKHMPAPLKIDKGKGKTALYKKPQVEDYPALENGGIVYRKEFLHDPLSIRDILDLEIISKGEFSLYNYFNRTKTYLGDLRFKRLLCNPFLDTEHIKQRQKVVAFLIKNEELRQSLNEILKNTDDKYAFNILKKKPSIKSFVKIMYVYLGILAVSLHINIFIFAISMFAIFVFFPMLMEMKDAKSALLNFTDKAYLLKKVLKEYPQIEGLPLLEEIVETLSALRDKKHAFSLVDCIKNRSYEGLSRLLNKKEDEFKRIFGAVAELDAYTAIAQNAVDHQINIFPKVLEQDNPYVNIQNAIHPLHVLRQLIEPNSIVLDPDETSFLTITGPNMNGKTTILKMYALLLVMAQIGSPVTAENMDFTPVYIRTHINTEDSLAEDMSKFDVESDRMLDHIMAAMQGKKTIFAFVGDEMFEGTEPTNRTVTQKAAIKLLAEQNVLGLVATQDLSIITLVDEIKNIKNMHFKEGSTQDGEAIRDYKLRPGSLKWEETNTLQILRRKKFPEKMLKYTQQYLEKLFVDNKIPLNSFSKVVNFQSNQFFEQAI
ncbi:MAG: hypothetical protein ABIG64_03550 [Candidatus Omnitrophota bacterium]